MGRGRAWLGRVRGAAMLALLTAACTGNPETVAPPEEAAAPRPPVEARSGVDRAMATTGDVITYTVTVDYDEGYEVSVPEPGADIAGFRILDVGREPDRSVEGRNVEERWYRLRADLVGSYVLPPVTVAYRERAAEPGAPEEAEEVGSTSEDGTSKDVGTVQTSAIFVEVESVLAAAEAAGEEVSDIRGLKPLQERPTAVPWAWLGGGAAALAALAAGLVLWRRRGAVEVPPVPPHEAAFAALEALRGTDFSDPEAVHRFHFEISEVVRTYVEGRFGLNATDLTTEEILPRLAGLDGLGEAEAGNLARFLAATDRVKFADHRPSEPEIEETWEGALGFVEATRPCEEPEEGLGGAARTERSPNPEGARSAFEHRPQQPPRGPEQETA